MTAFENDLSPTGMGIMVVTALAVLVCAIGFAIHLARVRSWRTNAASKLEAWMTALQTSLESLDETAEELKDVDADDLHALTAWIESNDAALDEVTQRLAEGRHLLEWSFPKSREHAATRGKIRRRLAFLTIRRRQALESVNVALQRMIPSVASRFGELKLEVGAVVTVLLTFLGLLWSLSYYAPKGVAVMPLLQRISDLALIGFTAGIVPLAVLLPVVAYFVWRVMRHRTAALRAGASARTIASALRCGARLTDRTFWIKRSVAILVSFVLVTTAVSGVEPFAQRYWLTISGTTLANKVDVVGGIGDYLVLREAKQEGDNATEAITILPRSKVECIQTVRSEIISCEKVLEPGGDPPPPPQQSREFRIAFPIFEIGESDIRKIDNQQLARGDRLIGVPEKLLAALRQCASLDGPIVEIRGFADSACFGNCDSDDKVKNVTLANSRANALRQAVLDLKLPYLKDMTAGSHKAPDEVGLVVRPWPTTDSGHDEMRIASSYADKDQTGNYRKDAGLLNRRAELLVTNAGSCAVQ